MSIRRGRSERALQQRAAEMRARDEAEHRRQLGLQAMADAQRARDLEEERKAAAAVADRAHEIMTMTAAEHRTAAARLMASAEAASQGSHYRWFDLLRANAHLGFAATAQRGDEQ